MKVTNKPKSLFCILVLLVGGLFLAEKIDQSPVSHAAGQFISHPAKPVVIKGAVDQPNVIMILADDMGWGDLACFGNTKILTPRLDQMAEEGSRFTQFYVQSGVCSPSRVGFMTGMFPSRLAIHTAISGNHDKNEEAGMPDWLSPNVPTITRILQSAGYTTGHFGKWHLGYCCGAPDPGQYGIDDHVTTSSTGPGFPQQGGGFRAESSRYIVDEAIEFMEANLDSPFYLNLWMLLPHATLEPTPEQLEVYDHLAPNGVPYVGARQIYYASVTAMDEQIGRLLDRLDELGLSENTLVVFTSDNGPAHPYARQTSHSGVGSSGPFRGGKRNIYEGGVRMPMIARWPGQIPAGAVDNDSVIAGIDFLPTVASLAGINLNLPLSNWQPDYSDIGEGNFSSHLDGEDMSDALFGFPTARIKPLFWEFRFSTASAPTQWRAPMLATRVGPWKLLLNPDLSRVELYDVVIDPKEVDNLADGYPDIVKILTASLLQWHESLPEGPIEDDAGSDAYPWP